jgi:hypothetical protein
MIEGDVCLCWQGDVKQDDTKLELVVEIAVAQARPSHFASVPRATVLTHSNQIGPAPLLKAEDQQGVLWDFVREACLSNR